MILPRIDFPKRQAQCSADGHIFLTGEKYHTLVFYAEKGWQRKDLCVNCWTQLQQEPSPAPQCSWQSSIAEKPKKEEPPKHKDERALALFKEKSIDLTQESSQEAYVLALYLARKKILLKKQEIDQGGERFSVYETAGDEAIFAIRQWSFDQGTAAALQQRIAGLLTC